MSFGHSACGDSWCSGCLVSCSNSRIIHVAMVVGPCLWVSLTGVMMLPHWQETGRLTDRSRCPPPLTSPKGSHVWNWFCRYYLPVGLTLPLSVSLSLPTVYKKYLIPNTQNIPVLMRTLSTTDWCSVFMWSVPAFLNVCMIDGAANARLWVFCLFFLSFLFFKNKQAVVDDTQTVKMLRMLPLLFRRFGEGSTKSWDQALY